MTVILVLTLVTDLLLNPTFSIAQKPNTVNLTVSAGAGLKAVLEDIRKVYQQQQSDINVTYNFAASGVLQRQIEQGANIDVLIAAASKNMDDLQREGLLLPKTRKNLIKSRVALIGSEKAIGVSSFQDLQKPSVKKIVIGEPRSVPLGAYAEEVFKYFGILEQIKPKLIYARSALEILTFVKSGSVDFGIVHDSAIRPSDKVKILAIAPEKSHAPAIYPAAVLTNSKNPQAAKSFMQFLSSEQAKALYVKYGYTLVR